ncbi:hypothetical protein BH23ACT5_BH23ACT5_05890 [soil metagenome]
MSQRLTSVKALLAVLALSMAIGWGPALTVSASSAVSAPISQSGQAGPTLGATVGLEGFVAPDRPSSVSAVISTPVLVSGRMRVRGGGISVSRPVEVPAGGEQVYELGVPPLEAGTRLTVELLDSDGDVIVSETIVVRSSFDEMAVGVVGDDQLVTTLGRVRTMVTDSPVAPLRVPASVSAATFDAVDYLILSSGGSDRLDTAMAWARSGGYLVVDGGLASALGLDEPPRSTGMNGVSRSRFGSGEVIVVDDLPGRSGDEWAMILRPVPLDLSNSPQFGWDQGGGLLQAASESGSRQVPSLPWLLFALLGFALVVGPVNFIVLSRLGKRDWAWVTIPVVAMLAVVGFWGAGRQRISGTTLSHASVIVDDGSLRVRSAVIVAAGVAGERSVGFDPTASLYPERSVFGGAGTEMAMVGGNTIRLDLEQLGFTGVGLVSNEPVGLPAVTESPEGITVRNDTDMTFWGWGAVSGGRSVVSASGLGSGQEGRVGSPGGDANMGFGFIDALMNQQRLWDDPQRSNALWPLSQVLNTITTDASTYFVGITDDYEPAVTVNAVPAPVAGPALVVIRLATNPDQAVRAGAQVVGTGFINWLDWGMQRVIATDEMTVGFRLDDPSVSVEFRDSLQFGAAPTRYEVWDWTDSTFEEITRGAALEAEHVSPDGQVYIRLVGQEFGDNPFSPDSLSLEPV